MLMREDPKFLKELGLIKDDKPLSTDSCKTPFGDITEQELSRWGALTGVTRGAAIKLPSQIPVGLRALAMGSLSTLCFKKISQVYYRTRHTAATTGNDHKQNHKGVIGP